MPCYSIFPGVRMLLQTLQSRVCGVQQPEGLLDRTEERWALQLLDILGIRLTCFFGTTRCNATTANRKAGRLASNLRHSTLRHTQPSQRHGTSSSFSLTRIDEMSNPTRTPSATHTRLSTVPTSASKSRQLSHLHAQLAQLTAHMSDLENLLRMTAVQAEGMRGLGGYAGGM